MGNSGILLSQPGKVYEHPVGPVDSLSHLEELGWRTTRERATDVPGHCPEQRENASGPLPWGSDLCLSVVLGWDGSGIEGTYAMGVCMGSGQGTQTAPAVAMALSSEGLSSTGLHVSSKNSAWRFPPRPYHQL